MNIGLMIGGVSIAVSTPPNGQLERILSDRYRHFMRSIGAPGCWLTFRPVAAPFGVSSTSPVIDADGDTLSVRHALFEGEFTVGGRGTLDVVSSVAAVDSALETVVAANGPRASTLLLHAAAVVSRGRGHLLLGRGSRGAAGAAKRTKRPVLGEASVALEIDDSRCLVHSTPFGADSFRSASVAPLLVAWMGSPVEPDVAEPVSAAQAAGWVLEHAALPTRSASAMTAAFDVAAQVGGHGGAAARVALGRDTSWDRLDELGAAVGYRRVLEIEQPMLRAGLLHGLEPPGLEADE